MITSAQITAMVEAGRPTDPAKIGVRAGKVINERKAGKHFPLGIGEGSFTGSSYHSISRPRILIV
jgi:hypothetical protein